MNTATDTTAKPEGETDTPTDIDTDQRVDMPTHLQKEGAKKNENTVSRRILDDRRKPHQGV